MIRAARALRVPREILFDASPRGRRQRRIAAGAISLALHVLLVLAFVGSRPGGVLASGGEATEVVEPYFEVSLAGLRRDDASSAKAAQSAEVQDLLRQLRQIQTDVAIQVPPAQQSRQSLDNLFEAVETERTDRMRDQTAASGRSDQDAGGRGADPSAPDRQSKQRPGPNAAARNPPQGSAGAGELWGFLEPCWKKLPGRSLVPVTLEVTLNVQGTISTPPKIIRPPSAPVTEARLVSEARALAALSACLPYTGRGMTLAPTQIEFKSI